MTVRTVCPHDCPDTCAILATVEADRVTRVTGDPGHPFTGGFLCAKVNRYPERVHSPERVLQPLRRAGPKGSGRWEPISWDAALATITERWQAIRRQWGPSAIMGYAYSGHMGLVSRNLPRALFHALGCTQVQVGTVCDTAAEAGWDAAYGPVSPLDPEAVAQADLVVAWGSDVATSNVHLVPFIERARARGAALVTIAPYRSRTARRADWFIPVRVGTDGALALGVAHVLFREGWADRSFLAREADGWESWAQEVLPRYAPDRVEALTGVPATDVERLAARLAGANAPFIRIGPAMARHRHGAMAVRLVALLAAVLGVWGRPGAGAFLETAHAFRLDYAALRRPDLVPEGVNVRWVNHAHLGRALTGLDDPPIKALLIMANNPAVTCPDAGRVREGLLREDLFTVVHESFMTDTAALADLVLPAATAFEVEDLFRSYGHLYLQYARPVMPEMGAARANAWVVQQLAGRLGLDDPVFSRPVEAHARALLRHYDTALVERVLSGEPVKVPVSGGPGRWATPSGRIRFTEPLADDAGGETPPPGDGLLRLLTAPGHFLSHTGFEGVATLRRREGVPRCLLHPKEAARRGITPGDPVEIANRRGRVGLRAEVSEDVPEGLVVVEGLRPAGAYLSGGPLNVLTGDALSDMGEGATYHSTWVEVHRLDRVDARAQGGRESGR